MNNIIENFTVIMLIVSGSLLLYALRSNRKRFKWKCWFQTNWLRYLCAVVLVGIVSILFEIKPEAVSVLGFDAAKTPIGIAFAIAAVLIGIVPGMSASKKS